MFKENNSKLLVFHKDKPDFIELYKSNIVSSGISVIASFTFDESEYNKVRLTNTKIYFEQIIVPYCQQNFTSIIKTINDQNIQNQFRNNFEKRKNIIVPNYEKFSTNFQIDISSCGSENQLNCDNLNLIEGVLLCNRIHNYVKFVYFFLVFLFSF